MAGEMQLAGHEEDQFTGLKRHPPPIAERSGGNDISLFPATTAQVDLQLSVDEPAVLGGHAAQVQALVTRHVVVTEKAFAVGQQTIELAQAVRGDQLGM